MHFEAESPEGAGHHRADFVDLHQRRLVGFQQRFQREAARQILRRGFADVTDAQRVNEAGERRVAAGSNRIEQVGGRFFGHALQPCERRGVEPVKVGRGAHVAAVDQLFDELFAQPFDVHGAARGKVDQRLLALRRAKEAGGAARHGFVLAAHDRRGADRAAFRHDEFRREDRALFGQYAHHFGDHVARAADHHRVADAHVLAPHFVLIVQRGVGHRDASDEDRRQPRHRGERAGAAHLHVDAEHRGQRFLRRIFVRHRPARFARDKAEFRLQGQ